MSASDRPPPPPSSAPIKETVQGIGAPPPPAPRTDSTPPRPSGSTPTRGSSEEAFLAFVDAAQRPHARVSTPPAARANADAQRPGSGPPVATADRASAPLRGPTPKPPPNLRSGASPAQLAAFAAVVVGASLTGYWIGKSSTPEVRTPWAPPSASTPAPLMPCIPVPPVDVEVMPDDPDPVESGGGTPAERSASGAPSASAAPSTKARERGPASATPKAPASATPSAKAASHAHDDPSEVL
ncbi:MAG: hypothetical protein U0414_37250 [Polyangiaceae bacterium]